MNNKIITCDIDGVLTDYPNCWLKFLQEKTGTLYTSTKEAKKGEPNYSNYKDMYRESNYKANLPVIESNKKALNKLAEKFDIIFVTSRPLNDKKYPHLKENTINWLKNNGLKFKELQTKDEYEKLLENFEIAFHIDDEVKYANCIAKQIKNENVYLLSPIKPLNLNSLEENVIVVKDVNEIRESPFFSVCIPATNRGDTIYNTLNSVAKQYYRNFELIIVDCKSKDNTVSEIERFFSSNNYKNHPFKYTFVEKDYTPIGTEDWNDPLELSNGKYIAMLEGDDKWLPEHLINAYIALTSHSNIGLYGSSNLTGKRSFQGICNNPKEFCYNIKDAIPPSESIFIKHDHNNTPFLYNPNDYKYSPEIGLYLDIVLDGYEVYYSQTQDVYREPSTNPDKMKTWYYFADRFVLINKYKCFFKKKQYIKSEICNGVVVIKHAFYTKSLQKGGKLIKNLINEIGIIITLLCIIFSVGSIFSDLIHQKL